LTNRTTIKWVRDVETGQGIDFVYDDAGKTYKDTHDNFYQFKMAVLLINVLTTEFEQHFSTAVGSEHMLQQFKHHTHHQRIRGMAKARVLLQHA
jgi:hypothetical protein